MLVIVLKFLKHFRSKEFVRTLGGSVFIFLFNECTDSKVDQDRLVVVINHDVFWLDISVDHLYDFVAVIQSLKNFYEIVSGKFER